MTKLIGAMALTSVAMASFIGTPGYERKDGAKAPASAGREAVEVRGRELLAMINEAGDDGLMLTQAEGLEAVQNGYAVVDTSVTEGETAKVTLTDAGRAAIAGNATAASAFEVEDGVEMPTGTKRRGRTGGYPFEILAVGQSFHVPVKAGETAADVAARMQSSVSGARTRFAEETGETETVMVKTYAKGNDGKFTKVDGKRVVATETQTTRPKLKATRDFTVKAVDASDPKGLGARIWRTA